jgi:hypothetical protein
MPIKEYGVDAPAFEKSKIIMVIGNSMSIYAIVYRTKNKLKRFAWECIRKGMDS